MQQPTSSDLVAGSVLDWPLILAYIEPDAAHLEICARVSKALVRCRRVKSASDLLRLVLAYAGGGASLARTGYWATEEGIASLSCPAISARVGNAGALLGDLLARYLERRGIALPRMPVRVRLIDATTASRANCRGVEWRIHLGLDLASMCIDEAEVTDAHGGETLSRHVTKPGEIIVGDAGYAHRKGMGSALGNGAHVIVRTNWQNLPLLEPGGRQLDISRWLSEFGSAWFTERPARVETPTGVYPVRVVVSRLPPAAAERARKTAIEKAQKNKHKVDPRTLQAAGFLILVTSLPDDKWTTDLILQLYRARWQIEMHIKRMKSILNLDHIRAQRPEVVHACILAKLILSMVVEDLLRATGNCHGAWLESADCPASLWTLIHTCWQNLIAAILGRRARLPQQLTLPGLRRYFIPPPRERVNRLAAALVLLRQQTNLAIQLPLPCATLS